MTQERMNELFNRNTSSLKICVGSWKAYNECNNHALGTCYKGNFYIDFELLESEEELIEVLDFLGWTKEEQEELFIQDYEGEDFFSAKNCDYINPLTIIKNIKESDVDLSRDGAKIAAIMESESCDFEEAIERADDFDLYENMTAEEYEEQLIDECYPEIDFNKLGWLGNYINIDFEAMARDDDTICEINGGVLVNRG